MTTTLTQQATQNIELIRAGYEAFAHGDLEAVRQAFSPDVIWHAQRLGQLGGDHRGWPAVAQFFGRTMELSQGTFRIELQDFLANDTSVAAVVRSMATRDGRHLDDRQIHLFHLEGARAVEIWQFVGDGEAVSQFWA
jgi:ketosteroid isomerase-like protein